MSIDTFGDKNNLEHENFDSLSEEFSDLKKSVESIDPPSVEESLKEIIEAERKIAEYYLAKDYKISLFGRFNGWDLIHKANDRFDDKESLSEDNNGKEYRKIVDTHRFYQRDLSAGQIDLIAPMHLYDTRIDPIFVLGLYGTHKDRHLNHVEFYIYDTDILKMFLDANAVNGVLVNRINDIILNSTKKDEGQNEININPKLSLVDRLNERGIPSNKKSRKELAQKYGMQDYTGTGEENSNLLSMLRNGEKPLDISPIIVDGGVIDRDIENDGVTEFAKMDSEIHSAGPKKETEKEKTRATVSTKKKLVDNSEQTISYEIGGEEVSKEVYDLYMQYKKTGGSLKNGFSDTHTNASWEYFKSEVLNQVPPYILESDDLVQSNTEG